jgi:hypothetical protein
VHSDKVQVPVLPMPHCTFGIPDRVVSNSTRLVDPLCDSVRLLFHQSSNFESVLASCQCLMLDSQELPRPEVNAGVELDGLVEEAVVGAVDVRVRSGVVLGVFGVVSASVLVGIGVVSGKGEP